MAGPNLENYVEVHTRIEKFYEKYPEGSLQSTFSIEQVRDDTFVVVKAYAYRTPEDSRPGVGLAWEPYPGLTPYTKGSELMVGETSAWGRAIASLGFEVNKGIASANEVRNRTNGEEPLPSPKQKGLITRRCNELALTDEHKKQLMDWAGGTPLTKRKASKLIELLKEAKDHADVWKRAGIEVPVVSDIPADVPEVEVVDYTNDEEVPFT